MKKFVKKVALAIVPLIIIFFSSFLWSIHYISSGDFFLLKPDVHSVILGDSHSACAYNDSLMDGFINLSQNNESYPYTYYKLKKILEENSNVKNVFIEYTNNLISNYSYSDIHGYNMDENMSRALTVSSKEFIAESFVRSKNIRFIFESIDRCHRNNLRFLIDGDNYIYDLWHTHKTPSHESTPEDIILSQNNYTILAGYKNLNTENINYLNKIKELCIIKNVSLSFVRSPLPDYVQFKNEIMYQKIKDSIFYDVPLIDMKNYPLGLDYFYDDKNLNVKGRKMTTNFFKTKLIQNI